MKAVSLSAAAIKALRKHRADADQIVARIERYARTGFGDVKKLKGGDALRLRVRTYRVIFEESATEIMVTKIGPRGSAYED